MDDQAQIIAALESGKATSEAHPLRRIDTHMSHLFLGERHAYKLKRGIRHPFSDMSSVEARRAACEMELEVNRAFAPRLYEAVLPVVRDPSGAIRLGGAGEAIDWVVAMQRFPDGALLTELAQDGRLTRGMIREAAETIAAFHVAQPPAFVTGHAADYRRIISSLERTEAAGAGALGVTPASRDLFLALDRALAHISPLIETRRKEGWVRRGHGDLHLRNICVIEGRVTPFDALEFDARLTTGDVLYDAAFLFMDLRARGLGAFANVAMNAYWNAAGQTEDALAVLPFFMALRAAVRMAVAVEGGDLTEAERYRGLGLDLLKPSRTQLVAIGGASQAGRSDLAQALAAKLPGPCGARTLDIERRETSAAAGHEGLAKRAHVALAAGSSVIAEAAFRGGEARDAIEQAAGDRPFVGLWLRDDAAGPQRPGKGRPAEPSGLAKAWTAIDAGPSPATAAEQARNVLARRQASLT